MKYLIGIIVWMISMQLYSQQSDSIRIISLKEITVSAFKEEPVRETSLNVTPIRIDSLTGKGNFNLAGLLTHTPGVSVLSTGIGIAKPVIRGSSGNRVLVLLSGLKFDNQQWQEEHGLGLTDIGLSTVELIKGPMSILYGSEAIGGIINLVEELPPASFGKESDLTFKFSSNTLGGLIHAGYKQKGQHNWYRVRAGLENHADYSDGNGNRVLNSRMDGYYLKGSFGFDRKRWSSANHFSSSFNRFGFIFNDIYTFVSPDARWSRHLDENPAHLVLLNILSSENKILLSHHSKLTVNAGIQSNERMENEGGGAISLNMHLLTFQYLVKWENSLNEDQKLIISQMGSFEDNTNFGARKIVPDAHMQESNLAVYHEINLHKKLIFENGLGAGEKWIRTFFTATVNSPEKDIQPFTKFSPYFNLFSGISYIPNRNLNIKVNVATGVRIPNLAELSSNGLHEGVFTYEIGDPGMKNEQNLSLNLLAAGTFGPLSLEISPFYTYFLNYVYLAPTTGNWYGFPVFRYRQQDAEQYGTESSVSLQLNRKLLLDVSYSGMISKTRDGKYTPYIPAQKMSPQLRYHFRLFKKWNTDMYAGTDYCFRQDHGYEGEITTPDYLLLNAGIHMSVSDEKLSYDLELNGSNLLNKAYYDHLSRFKNYGLLNIGRNISFMLNIKRKELG